MLFYLSFPGFLMVIHASFLQHYPIILFLKIFNLEIIVDSYSWCLADTKQLSSESFMLLDWSFLGPLIERAGFLRGFFLSVPIGIFRLPASATPSQDVRGQKKSPGNPPPCCSSGPQIVCLLLSTFQSPFVFVFYVILGISHGA